MAEQGDKDSKTEEASPKKLDEARKKGDVAKSADLPQALSLAAACSVLALSSGTIAEQLGEALLPFIIAPHELVKALDTGAAIQIARYVVLAAIPIIVMVMVGSIVLGVGVTFLQTGFLFAPAKLKPDFKTLNPINGLKRLFGLDALVNFFKSLVKVTVTGIVVYVMMAPKIAEMVTMVMVSPIAILPYSRDILVAIALAVCLFLIVGGGLDYLWQRYRFLQRMKMSREEVKEEYKQMEGDPHVKARIRQIRMERSRQRMMANVPKATVVITNPTHYAVALRYVAGETAAPECVAKGTDKIALKIRELAKDSDVPIIEDPPLARALYATVDVDETIPREHFEAVAKLISFIMTRKATGARRP